MMVGLPGVGKSTIIEDLTKDFPGMKVISTDEYIENYAKEKGKTYNEVYRELGDKPQKWMNAEIQKVIKNKGDFIWDQTNVFASARSKKHQILRQNHYESIVVVVELSDEEHKKRIDQRKNTTGKYISTKIVNDMKLNYSRPNANEGWDQIILIQDDGKLQIIYDRNKLTQKKDI